MAEATSKFESKKKMGLRHVSENAAKFKSNPHEYYDMNHKYRGKAIIFKHEYFDIPTIPPRPGTATDCTKLIGCLTKLGFSVDVLHDLEYVEVINHIEQISKMNHSDNDCLLIVVLTHGESGMLYARDTHYRSEKIWLRFTEQNCPTLAGKPKLFFFQACQGCNYDDGVTLRRNNIETDGWFESHKNPTEPDFLLALSTVPGYYSWRNTSRGSWFVQALCEELSYWGTKFDILTLLTFVSQKVALNFQSNTDFVESSEKKQVPCISSLLTRRLVFTKKPGISGKTSFLKRF